MANDARRRGPIYKFRIYIEGSDQLIDGIAERYCVRVTSEHPIPEPLKSQLLRVLNSLMLDAISVTSVRQDGNNSEPV